MRKTKFNLLKYILIMITLLLIFSTILHECFKQGWFRLTKYSGESQIDTLISLDISDIEQWILIRGESRSAPVLLILHGGPGAPIFPGARKYGHTTGVDKFFITVYWEQPGTGKSYHMDLSDTAISVQSLVMHAHEITSYLKKQYKTEKIYLMGKSFGSLIGMLLIQKYPHDYYAFISVSQFVNPLKNDSISFEIVQKWAIDNNNYTAIKELKSIGLPPYTPEELLTQRKWATRLHDSQLDLKSPDYLGDLLRTPEYSIFDIIIMGLDPFYSLRTIWTADIYKINLAEQIPYVSIPVHFFTGKHDVLSIPALIYNYFEKLEAPAGKRIYIFDASGHEPDISEPEKFIRTVKRNIINHQNSVQAKFFQQYPIHDTVFVPVIK